MVWQFYLKNYNHLKQIDFMIQFFCKKKYTITYFITQIILTSMNIVILILKKKIARSSFIARTFYAYLFENFIYILIQMAQIITMSVLEKFWIDENNPISINNIAENINYS